MKTYTYLLCIVVMTSLLTSCKREFEHDVNFKNEEVIAVLGDNALLFSKIFQLENNNAYLWFDIRNEIANFSSPFLGHAFTDNGIDRFKRIDLRGTIYSYNDAAKELTVVGYPLDIATGSELPADMVYDFDRKQKNGCELITDATQRRRCETTFTLQLKRVVFEDIGLTLEADKEVSYNSKVLKMSEMKQDIMLIN